ncbi:hypothetical protein ACI2KG_00670 [Pseudomonas sp. NPDC089407]|uniref:hypothetical protein n=1 Tax=Pseudomonas sp. NPDC089407 TaxID=3364464 RepID=UPI00384C7717
MDKETIEHQAYYEQLKAASTVTVDEFLSFLEEKGLDDMPCELCQCKEWAVSSLAGTAPDIVMKNVCGGHDTGFYTPTKRAFFYCFCMGCGNTKEFYADYVLKLMKPESPEAALFDERFEVDRDRA